MQIPSNNLINEQARLSIDTDFKTRDPPKLDSNIMLREIFSGSFKKHIWEQIRSIQPQIFLGKQEEILNFLMRKQDQFEKYFFKFYNNHTQLYHWFVLASQKHEEMKDYVFFKILKKTIKQYRMQMKSIVSQRKHQRTQTKELKISKFCLRSIPGFPKKIVFKKNQGKMENVNNHHKMRNLSEDLSKDKNEDYHQLFIDTLAACSGQKYIHYNFIKHQEGYEMRGKYNNFIRIKKKVICKKNLKNYQEQIQSKFNVFDRHKSYEQDNNYPKNIVSMYKSFYQSPKVPDSNGVLKLDNDKQNKTKYTAFVLTPIGNASKMKKTNKKVQMSRKNLVIKKLPNRFGKQILRQTILCEMIQRELEMPLLR